MKNVMLIIIRKWLLVFLVGLLFLIPSFPVIAGSPSVKLIPSFPVIADSLSGKKIGLDPGHGGHDPGAVGWDGPGYPNEEDFNLDVGLRLRTQLQSDAATVVMTRTTDTYVSLDARVNFINNENPHAFISIHCNSFTDPSAHGTETYWHIYGTADDQRLAGDVQTRLVEQLGRRDRGVKQADFRVLEVDSWIPAVLGEMLFISNQEEFNLISSDSGKNKAVSGFRLGIFDFFGTTPGLPDLTPYQPSGWSDKIVVSKVTGTHTDDPNLTPNDTLYVDWAVANQGDADITDLFYYYLYVDGEYVAGWYSDGLRAGYYVDVEDYSIGKLSAGPHTIKIFADATRVISESDEGNNEYSKPISIEEGKPNPPTLVSPPNGSHQTCSITFQWTSVPGATKYKLFVKLPGSPSWLSDETTATTYPYSPTLMGEYHWKVQAYANGNWSDDSSEWIFYFDGVTAPTLISPPNGSEITDLRPTFRWNSVACANWYQLQLARDSSFTDLVRDKWNIYDTFWQLDQDLDKGQTYYWRVCSQNPIGHWSDVWHFRISPPQYTLTTSVTPSEAENDGCSISLNPSGGTYDAGTVVTLTANPNPSWKWKFDRWSGDLSGSSNPTTITMDSDKSVTAHFTKIQYTLTTSVSPVGSGSIDLDPPGGTYECETVVTLTANPNSGWKFDHWSGDLSGSDNPTTITMDSDKNVTAHFVEIPKLGDVSGNGKITAYDASLVLQHVVGLRKLSGIEQERADVTGDGTISALDAALILQYTVGLITRFPADSPPVAPAMNPKTEINLLAEAIEKLDTTPLTKEQKQVLEQLKNLVFSQLIQKHTTLLQNYPNPFNPETWIPFKLAQDAPVTIRIYDTKGQLIRTIALGNRNAGVYTTKDKSAYWDGRDNLGEKVASGVYFYTLQAGEFRATQKMVIMK